MHAARAEAVGVACRALGPLAQRDVPIGPLTTYRVGGAASVLVQPKSVDDLLPIAAAANQSGLPVLVIGRGSNLLVADAGFNGIVVTTADMPTDVRIDDATSLITADAGVLLPVLARKTAHAGLTGFEWAVGVPGSLGGAVRMNAGGHGSDIAASLLDTRVADLTATDPESMVRELDAEELELHFRGSAISSTDLVLSARLQLKVGNREAAEREIAAIVAWRREHQPGGQNAGSVFVNPVPGEVSAGELIDRLGMRGLRHRTASISEKHANFIQADEGGSADDVRALMEMVRLRVEDATGYALRTENRLIGFTDGSDD